MAEILYGLPVVEGIKENLIKEIKTLSEKGILPTLGIIRVGNRPDDMAYEKRVLKNSAEIGLGTRVFKLNENSDREEFISKVKEINENENIHGILLFRPLPDLLEQNVAVNEMISPKKDIDCMHHENLRKVFEGDDTGHLPCTPEAVLAILRHYNIDREGANIVIVNRSLVIGKPLSMILLKENATVTLCHSKTKNLMEITKKADIVVTGIGKGEFFTKDYFNKDSIIIDVGINYKDGKMCGDVKFDEVEPEVKAITPVPGGVGLVTSSILLKHVIDSIK
ncbi:MAG: bifunctional 5,10-methylenetetrahydrofolate dehydrogenase/5,10-methenyltetrahydrofolate cyclohydrolase [Peptostreptococcales bacterium]